MKKITKKHLTEKVNSILKNGIVPEIESSEIHEFKLGKNYFCEIKNNENIIAIQKWINEYFHENIPLNNSAIAFRKNLSYLDLFEPHRKNYYFLRLDIRSFFHTIKITDIKKIFHDYFDDVFIDENKQQSLLEAFLNIICYRVPENSHNESFRNKKVLPMGFITSPIISNIIFRPLDIIIQKFCNERNILYTRYADDMLFSSSIKSSYVHSKNFENEISIYISKMNFKLNKTKTIRKKHTLSLNGYTIEHSKIIKSEDVLVKDKLLLISELRISNKKIYIIKKMIHFIVKEKRTPKGILNILFNYNLPDTIPADKIETYYIHQLINKLTGYRSYLLSIVIYHNKFKCCQNDTLEKYYLIIKSLNKLIEKYNKLSEGK